ncbi:hypothetical protein JXM67_04370 [candidate division WOR-3 bacterium]|nr:hypothetical protein [candidate division WOR-3 bacterium]
MKKNRDVITIPVSVWESAETKEDLEDWLLAHNPGFIRRMREAHQEVKEGKTVSLDEL